MGFKDYLEEKKKKEQKSSEGNKTTETSSNGGFKKYLETVNNPNNGIDVGTSTLTIDDVSNWSTSVGDISNRVYNYLKTDGYKKADTELAKELDKYLTDSVEIRRYLKANKSKYSNYADVYSVYEKQVDSLRSLRDSLNNSNKFYSKYETEDDYNADVERGNQYYNKWGHYADKEDFETTSKNRNFVNPTDEDLTYYDAMMDYNSWYTDANGKMYDAHGNEIPYVADKKGNIIHPLQNDSRFEVSDPLGLFLSTPVDERENFVYGTQQYGKKFETLQEGVVNHWEMITPDETSMYYYLLNTQGKDEALEYLRDTAETRNYKYGKKVVEDIQNIDNGFIRTISTGLLGLEAGADQYATGIANIIEGGTSPTSGIQYASAEMSNSLDGLGKYAYNATVTVGNMLTSILTSKLLGAAGVSSKFAQGVGSAVLGASAGGNAYNQALKEGYSESQAQTYGVLVGASEALLQNLIGGIGSLGGISDDILLAKTKMIDNSFLRISARYGIKIGSEIVEEELQNFLEPAFRSIIFGEDYDAPTIDEILETAVVTALSTGALEGGSTITTDIAENRQFIDRGKSIMSADGVGDLVNLANELDEKNISKLANNVSSNADNKNNSNNSARKIGRLYEMVEDATANLNQGDIVKSLVRNGFSEKEASTLAEAMIARDSAIQSVAQNFIKSGFSSEEANAIASKMVEKNNSEFITSKQNRILNSYKDDASVQSAEKNILANENSTIAQRNQKLDAFDNRIALGLLSKALANDKSTTEGKISPLEENIVENEFEVSADGKTINNKNDKIVNIKKIESISKDGEVNLTLDDGMVVKASDLTYGSNAEAIFISTIGAIKLGDTPISTTSANALYITAMKEFKNKPNMTSEEAVSLVQGLKDAYIFGAYNNDISQLTKTDSNGKARYYAGELTQEQRDKAYQIGRQDSVSKVDAKQKAIDSKVEQAKKKGTIQGKKGKIIFEDGQVVDETALSDVQKANLNGLKMLAELSPINFHVFKSTKINGKFTYTMKDGSVTSANGWYVSGTNDIYIDLNAGQMGEGTMLWTAAHEISHYIREWSPKKWQAMADFIMQEFSKQKDVSVESMLNKQIAKIKRRPDAKSKTASQIRDEAYEELVSDALSEMLVDGSVVNVLAEIKQKDKKLWQKIKEAVQDLLKRWGEILGVYEGRTLESEEAKVLKGMEDTFKQLQKMFADAFADANATFEAIGETKHTTTEGDVKFMARDDVLSWDINWDSDNFSDIKSQLIKHIEEVNKMKVVTKVTYSHSNKKSLSQQVDELLKNSFGYKIETQNYGTILFDPKAIDKAINYINNPAEAAALLAAPYVLKRGKAISGHKNHKNKGNPSVTFAAPAELNGEIGNIAVSVLYGTKHRIHALRVLTPSGKVFELSKTKDTESTSAGSTTKSSVRSAIDSVSTDSISQKPKKSQIKLSDRADIDTQINQSMTMDEAKQMIQRAFVLGKIQEWYDGEYKNGDDWLRGEGADEVALYIENEYTLQEKYLNKIEGIIDDEFYVVDILEAYLNGTLVGKEKAKAKRLDVSVNHRINDTRFYSPQHIENVKQLFDVANQKLTTKNRSEVTSARAKILIFAHNPGASELLGLSQAELNKKLRSWSGYTAGAREASKRVNNGVADSNKWTGIENCSWLYKNQVTTEELESLVKNIEGAASDYEKLYVARTMLALDTHIDWSWLSFEFDTFAGVNKKQNGSGKCNGFYRNDARKIVVSHNKPHTVAHEMGHALDYQWGRDLGFSHSALTETYRNTERITDADTKQFFDNFKIFLDSLTDNGDIRSEYTQDPKEVFARFVARFVQWVDNTGGNHSYTSETDYYNDKFTASNYIEFVKLLQEKAMLDAKKMEVETTKKSELKLSERDLAPTFYSQMGKVVEGVKQEKLAANSVVNMLRGKGVKAEEIRWSGIVPFLEGKKSVTKQELLDFINSSMLQIGEQMSSNDIDLRYDTPSNSYTLYDTNGKAVDTYTYNEFIGGYVSNATEEIYSNSVELEDALREEYGSMSSPRWSQYKLDGGSNYREIVFTMPNSSYSNHMMKTHWGEDAEGVLAHARIQDFDVNGKKMLFIEEIQSDWHNEGHKVGYEEKSLKREIRHELHPYNQEKIVRVYEDGLPTNHWNYEEKYAIEDDDWNVIGIKNDEEILADFPDERGLMEKIPDAPFKDNYHEYVLKRLLRMAAEQDYDSIGWTTAQTQDDRWNDHQAHEDGKGVSGNLVGYTIEYDQDMPKFLRKYGRQWGATVSKTSLNNESNKAIYVDTNGKQYKGIREWYEAVMDSYADKDQSVWNAYIMGQVKVIQEENTMRIQLKRTGKLLDEALNISYEPDTVWSMDIPDSMKESVLYEGQVMYSDRDSTTTTRSILANALESVAQNDIEKNKLAEYKEKISQIEAEEQRLSKIQKELFTKDGVEPSQRKELQFEAKQIANRINTYDRQLLKLEATKPLQNVLNREKALAIKRQKQKDNEYLKQYKEKVAKTTKELITRNQESRKKAVDSRKKTAMRHRIKGLKQKLEHMLQNPTDRQYIPFGLAEAIIDVCSLINTDTSLYLKNGEINKAQLLCITLLL